MKIKFLLPVGMLLLASGCAFTVHDLPVNYEYSGTALVAAGDSLPNIVIAEIEDIRTVENPRMIMNQKNGYGQTTTGGWQAEKELSLIVRDALVQGIEAAKLDRDRSRTVTIDGQLVDVSSSVVSGWTKGTVNTKVTVKLNARKEGSNEILWRDTLVGNGTSSKQSSINPALLEAFSSSLDDLVTNLLRDEYFRQQVLD